ncbi:hypothetical protein BDF20DRAFT_887684 [Mycotypha africana]|uniref:uncharacterized protein n=1 Tax=Mycotypha africana TaxID=64632 RepID=UPI002301E245|nr:uncharacterized protein BDF20DRAFT_892450 [Mycotypha africana]XP_052933746.1 uncharacterized protein BDF20DRAFT_887684 [Mycotypha africana]KAI8968950.1 hypothetical protein BDF20DRAFT_892450 [Mycotypha africana]KAI8971979.1 hypothetical protein BDF20DRAFT_887684 [Mycotypha africana]
MFTSHTKHNLRITTITYLWQRAHVLLTEGLIFDFILMGFCHRFDFLQDFGFVHADLTTSYFLLGLTTTTVIYAAEERVWD